jgi:hypothetical protein
MYNEELYGSYALEDTRYYGVFLKGRGEERRVWVDPTRFQKSLHVTFDDDMMSVINRREGPLFLPAKKRALDYNANFASQAITEIRREWESDTKLMIGRILSEICGTIFTPGYDELLQCGILDYEEAVTNANIKMVYSQYNAAEKKNRLRGSLYAQYFQQMSARIEALTVKLLTMNHWEGDKFDRNVLYAFKGNKPESVMALKGFSEYSKMYAIWNFLKHNSASTYKSLKDNFADVLCCDDYKQGDLACYCVNLDDSLIDAILDGVAAFLKGYCCLVFGENVSEVSWNFDRYFLDAVYAEIEAVANPLGLPAWM